MEGKGGSRIVFRKVGGLNCKNRILRMFLKIKLTNKQKPNKQTKEHIHLISKMSS